MIRRPPSPPLFPYPPLFRSGLLVAEGGIGLIVSAMPAETAKQVAGWRDIGLNGRAVAFAMAVTILSALLSGLMRSEEHTSELQSRLHLVCRLLLEKKKKYHL